MTKLYLITGFLGAGKTTFLHKFAGVFKDKKIAVIINEFGKKGVDGVLVKDLGLEITEINNGSIFCACKIDQFSDAVKHILKEQKPDLICVEASGLSDPTAVRSIFADGDYEDMEYAGAICLVDALRFTKLYETSKVCRMQVAISDLVLINKTDLAEREMIDAVRVICEAQNEDRAVLETSFGEFKDEWLDLIGKPLENTGKTEIHTRDITLHKLNIVVKDFDKKTLEHFLKMIADETYRIKGFVDSKDGVLLANCVGPLVNVEEYSGETEDINNLTVLYGNGLRAKKAVEEAIGWFADGQIVIE